MRLRAIKNFSVVLGWLLLLVERVTVQISFSMDHLTADDDERSSMLQQRDFYRKKLIPLEDLTRSKASFSCSDGLVPIHDIVVSGSLKKNRTSSTSSSSSRIPMIVHQTSKSRCLAPELANLVQQWQPPQLEGELEYFFHDDDAVDYLLQQDFPEFPTLSSVLGCILSPTLKADLWRYILLWEYGGIYADLDSTPRNNDSFIKNLMNNNNDTAQEEHGAAANGDQHGGFFVVDHYHYLSQYFMALAPRHLLMYYTIQAALSNILLASDTGSINPARTTGPTALHHGFQKFMLDAGVEMPDSIVGDSQKARGPVKNGVYKGGKGFSIRVVGENNDNEVIRREGLKRGAKVLAYQKMGMKHFSKTREATNTSCLSLLYEETLSKKATPPR